MFIKKDILYSIDSIQPKQNILTLTGWANSLDPKDQVSIRLTDFRGNPVPIRLERTFRNDVSAARYLNRIDIPFGFQLSFTYEPEETYYLILTNEKHQKKVKINQSHIWMEHKYKDAVAYFKRKKIYTEESEKPMEYDEWFRKTSPQSDELKQQAQTSFPENSPVFSIVIPLYKTPVPYLKALMDSIKDQTYSKWEVCFADGSPLDNKLEDSVRKISHGDSRFHYQFLGENKGISGNTNEAVKMASGDFIVLCDHDDLITPNALYEFTKQILEDPECDCLYSDEDKVDETGREYFMPHFKPDFNIDLLTSTNYICHLFAVRKTLVDKYGAFDPQFDGAQDYDFIFRMTENSRHIAHVAKILYHWRTHKESTSAHPESKPYAFLAGGRAIEAHYHRVWPQIQIEKIENGASLGIYQTVFRFDQQPLISIVIPNMDHTEDLDKALRSIFTKSTWHNLEVIIIENNSRLPETFEYYDKIQKEFPQVHVEKYDGSFNYSKINNFGVQFAHGEYILLMNNDVELIAPGSIEAMMGYAQRDDVGIVGCRLLYEDNTIQHAGVVIGVRGIADHVFKNSPADIATYFNRALTAQDYSAVTAAVMLVKKSVFDQLHGFDETFAVSFNDIDLCMRARKAGKLVVYTPYASFYHYESKSRGMEDSSEKVERFAGEIKHFLTVYKDFILQGDPYYNPNLTVRSSDYSFRNLAYEHIGRPFYSREYIQNIDTKTSEEIIHYTGGEL